MYLRVRVQSSYCEIYKWIKNPVNRNKKSTQLKKALNSHPQP